MLERTAYNVTVELLEPMLGTVPKRKEVYRDYIAAKIHEHAAKSENSRSRSAGAPLVDGSAVTSDSVKALVEEEVETVPEMTEEEAASLENKGWTGFHEDENGPFIYNYIIRGALSAAASAIKEIGRTKQLRDKVKKYVFVEPRRIYVGKLDSEPLERPLRAMTAQGPRVTVVRSDVVPAGRKLKFKIVTLDCGGISKPILTTILDYWEFQGLGQWRTGGYGRCKVVSIK